MKMEILSSLEATVSIVCIHRRPYTSLGSISLNVTIAHHNTPTNSKNIDHRIRIPCGGSRSFSTLYNTIYYGTASWEQVTRCNFDILETLRTPGRVNGKSFSYIFYTLSIISLSKLAIVHNIHYYNTILFSHNSCHHWTCSSYWSISYRFNYSVCFFYCILLL